MVESKKKILVVVESIDVDDSSGSKANVALIQNLYKAGFKLRVYHYTRRNVNIGEIPCYSIKENRKSVLFILSRLERYLRYLLNLKFHKIIDRVFGFSFTHFNDRNSIISGLQKIKDFRPDLILTLSKGASFRPHHALVKIPEWHSKWIAYVHDPYPFACYPRPYDWVEPGFQKKRDFFLKVSDRAKYVAYPSLLLAELMESYYLPLNKKRVIIPHQINENFTKSTNFPNFFEKDAFVIMHAGLLLGPRNPMGLIRAFEKFVKETPEAEKYGRLIFLGSKSKYSRDFKEIKKNVPQFFSTDQYIPFSAVLALQKNAAVNVILEAKSSISPFLPGKFPHCIEAGKPILLLGPALSESRRLLGANYPFWSEIDDEEKILKILKKLFTMWNLSGKNLNSTYTDQNYYLSERYLKDQISRL